MFVSKGYQILKHIDFLFLIFHVLSYVSTLAFNFETNNNLVLGQIFIRSFDLFIDFEELFDC